MKTLSDRFSTYMKHQIDQINLHLPTRVMTLRQVLMLKEPQIKTRDGNIHHFDSDDLEYLKSIIPPEDRHRVQLPMIITRRRDFGPNAYVMGGDIGNLFAILSFLEDDIPLFTVWKHNPTKNYVFYRVQLRKIRKKFSTTTVIAFA